jgi:N-acetylmuramoyl-L-alanine amidase
VTRALPAALLALALVAGPGTGASAATGASTAATLFAKAEADFAALRSDPARQRLRQSYTKVLEEYRTVFDAHPKTRQAEQALLRAGALHALLYTWTRQQADLNRAQNYYERLIAAYPRSSLADDAQLAIAYLYLDLSKDPAGAWLKFRDVEHVAPAGDKVPEARRMLKRLAQYAPPAPSAPPSDAELDLPCPAPTPAAPPAAPPARQGSATGAPSAPAAAPATAPSPSPDAGMPTVLARVRGIRTWSNPEYSRVVVDLDRKAHFFSNLLEDRTGSGKPPRLYLDLFSSLAEDRSCQAIQVNDGIVHTIRAAQFTPDSVRVVLDLDRLGTYRIFPMENPFRLVIDVTGGSPAPPPAANAAPPAAPETRLAPLAPITVPEIPPLPQQAAASAPAPAAAPAATLAVPALPAAPAASASAPAAPAPGSAATPASESAKRAARGARPPAGAPAPAPVPTAAGRISLAQQLGLGVRRVIIDAGHGAHDPGAIGVGGLQEKEVTLDLALRLRDILRQAGLDVVLTRDRDVFLPLEERTAIANKERGDLFLSIHCNSSDRGDLRGVETYYLNLTSNRRAMATAARENSMAVANMSDLNEIVRQIFNSKMDESSRFAESVQRGLQRGLSRRYRDVVDHGVKQAPFYVLIGAEMPSILAEVSFINNPVEGRRLADPAFRQLVAESLAEGVRRYVRTVKTAALPGAPAAE